MPDQTEFNWEAALEEAQQANEPEAMHDRVHPAILAWLKKSLADGSLSEKVPPAVTIGSHCVSLDLALGSFDPPLDDDTQDRVVKDWMLMFLLGYAFRNAELAGEVDLNGD